MHEINRPTTSGLRGGLAFSVREKSLIFPLICDTWMRGQRFALRWVAEL